MDREDKILETALDQIISRCNDIKNSVGQFIGRIENEPNDPVNWPTMLDNFVLISSQVSNLMRAIRNENTPALHNRVFLPLELSPERDEQLQKLTEGRVQAFNHEMVPNYLRTKSEPEIEKKERELYSKSLMADLNDQTQKQITSLHKIVTNIVDSVKLAREEWDTNESNSKQQQQATTIQQDTFAIIAAINSGKGLRPGSELPLKPGAPIQLPTQQPQQKAAPGKAPMAIKTNIKTNIHNSNNPYNRPN